MQGVSEGGLIGPLCFNSFMDTLTTSLLSEGCGIGVGIDMPTQWASHNWKGIGIPDERITKQLVDAITAKEALPGAAALASCSTLEASALLALDRSAKFRIVSILHADDPLLLASSLGGAQKIQVLQADWAYRWKVTPHCGNDKSVVMACGPLDMSGTIALQAPLIMQLAGRPPTPLAYVVSHKWLALYWHYNLDLSYAMKAVMRNASAKFAILSGLVVARMLPLCVVLKLFDALVEGCMRFGRWLYATAPGAGSALNDLYEKWARSLIGAPPWRSWAVAFSELGWQLTGEARAIIDIASKRAYLWRLEPDIYQNVFIASHSRRGDTWAKRSASMLTEWGILDWPAWSHPESSLDEYKRYVRHVVSSRCHLAWRQAVSSHVIPVSYLDLKPNMSTDFADAFSLQLQWHSMMLQRSLSRLRAGLLDFGHLDRRHSAASRRRCIFCNTATLSVNYHVLCKCSVWMEFRQLIWQMSRVAVPATMQHQVEHIMVASPYEEYYGAVLAFAGSLDSAESKFWEGCGAA